MERGELIWACWSAISEIADLKSVSRPRAKPMGPRVNRRRNETLPLG